MNVLNVTSSHSKILNESGQGVTEYILLLGVVVSVFMLLAKGMSSAQVTQKLLTPINQGFAHAYQYGHPKARGPAEGGPSFHPRYTKGENNFRIFINPEFK